MRAIESTILVSPAPGQNERFQQRHGVNGRRRRLPTELRTGPAAASARGLRPLGALLGVLLVLALEAGCLPVLPAAALSLPWRQAASDVLADATGHTNAALQEVPPPEAVQQLQAALSARQPVVEIVSPEPDSVLPAGPWTLRLRVHDWPLVDGGDLGIGPHLVVQLDQQPPQIWTRSEGEMPELSPGSHRLTVYAALPWGEARKTPGSACQIRLHRTAANTLSLPASGSPQLLAVSPSGPVDGEPLLLDWLLLDAPLQDVGGRGIQWRLRVSINGDDLLLDQQVPLWLRGWRPGANALRLELLDARGEPLNPPFNSLVQEVDLSASTRQPRWRGGLLSAEELAILVGDTAPSARVERTSPAGRPSTTPLQSRGPEPAVAEADRRPEAGPREPPKTTIPDRSAEPTGSLPPPAASLREPAPALQPATLAPLEPPGDDSPLTAQQPQEAPKQAGRLPLDPDTPKATEPPPQTRQQTGHPAGPETASQVSAEPSAAVTAAEAGSASVSPDAATGSSAGVSRAQPSAEAKPEKEAQSPTSATPASISAAAPTLQATVPSSAPEAANEADTATPRTATTELTADSASGPATQAPASDASSQAPQITASTAAAPRPDGGNQPSIRASTELTGRARDLVNDDGTLRRPEPRGPLASLRERLQR